MASGSKQRSRRTLEQPVQNLGSKRVGTLSSFCRSKHQTADGWRTTTEITTQKHFRSISDPNEKNARSELGTLRNSRKDTRTGCYGNARPIWPLNRGVLVDWAQIKVSCSWPLKGWLLLILPAAYQSAPWCGSTDPGSALRGSPAGRWCLVGTPQQQPWEEGEQPSWRGGGSCLSADEAHLCCSYMSSPTLHRHSLTPLCFLPFHHWIFPGISLLMSSLLPGPPFSFKNVILHFLIFLFFDSFFSQQISTFLIKCEWNPLEKQTNNKNPISLNLALGLKSSDLKSWKLNRGRWIVWPVGGCRGNNNNVTDTSWR